MGYPYTAAEQDQVRRYRRAQVLGDRAGVREEIESLVAQTGADEVMVMSSVHSHGERLRSYELLAEAFGLEAGDEGAPAPAESPVGR
jgi:alkanesulfonate monooxygenase SsuD/methylene tetrahydromethanopterin reductase-like flavin-dependent oxidoreductase (luciferase family)